MTGKATDWDAYYKRPAAPAQLTRRISAARIVKTLRPALSQPGVTICELGGANSCFIDDFLALPSLAAYHIIDNKRYGLELVRNRLHSQSRVSTELADVMAMQPREKAFDVVYSVGLIEHFDRDGTARCIETHFDLCRPGGTVLITFPPPTLPYRAIRSAAESLRIWAFPDERPLGFDEVVKSCARHGEVLHQSINWWIGLTQGYVLTRKSATRAGATEQD